MTVAAIVGGVVFGLFCLAFAAGWAFIGWVLSCTEFR